MPKRNSSKTCKTTPAARSARKPDPIWDTICELFALKPVTKPEKSRIGKVVRDLKAKGATPAGIRDRYARAKAEWTDARTGNAKMFGPEAITKNWDQLGAAEPDEFDEMYREAADG